jgi:hypothetical protein
VAKPNNFRSLFHKTMHQKRRKADFIEPKNQLGSIEESKDIKHSIKIIDRFEKLKRLS